MSFILDALKKAEAERNLGASTTMAAPPVFATHGKRPSGSRKRWPSIALPALAILSIALAGGAWYETTQEKASPVAATPTAPQAISPRAEEKAATDAAPTAAASTAPAPATASSILNEKPVRPKERIAAQAPEKKARPKNDGAKPPQASATPSDPPVATLRELPDQIQREIPPLAIGGYLYSGNRADRTVLINKRLLHEGDEVVPGLTLEKLMPNGMVLSYKGYRYRTSY